AEDMDAATLELLGHCGQEVQGSSSSSQGEWCRSVALLGMVELLLAAPCGGHIHSRGSLPTVPVDPVLTRSLAVAARDATAQVEAVASWLLRVPSCEERFEERFWPLFSSTCRVLRDLCGLLFLGLP
ncbi:unnamed protein product, partial [Polarella glacialis]